METEVKLSSKEFEKAVRSFHGTDQYFRHRLANGMFLLLTDGCNYIRENAGGGAYWLFDLILSWQMKLRKQRFQEWILEKQLDGTWFIECQDGNKNYIAGQEIDYSDFPLEKITIWVVDGVAMLPSEY